MTLLSTAIQEQITGRPTTSEAKTVDRGTIKALKRCRAAEGKSKLDLSGLNLGVFSSELIKALECLRDLEHLMLGKNRISHIPETIWKLRGLSVLDLSYNRIRTIPEGLGFLRDLKTLRLQGNQIEQIPESFGKLRRLATLLLHFNRIERISESVGKLWSLTTLNLGNNRITEIPGSFGRLQHLVELHLGENQITQIPKSFGNLRNLTSLYLQNNLIRSIPKSFGDLQNLASLYLQNNKIEQIDDSFGNLANLLSLDLRHNRIARIPESFGNLQNLATLNLQNNRIEQLPESFGDLQGLTSLDLQNNRILRLPDSIGALRLLEELKLRKNLITELPTSIGRLRNLASLYLHQNQISQIPESVGNLHGLNTLYLSDNRITKIPRSFGNLQNLMTLYLSDNEISQIPSSIGKLPNIEGLFLSGNPLSPELSAAYAIDTQTVLEYLRERALDSVKLFEAKLILVGEGAVGKSCLLDALQGKNWVEHESTHGIRLESFSTRDRESGQLIKLNGWDFGGQKVYRPTHQLFFSSPAVYLVVWKPREGSQAGAVREWIRLICHREPEAKILVVATHGGPGGRLPDIDEYEIRREFGEDLILGFHTVDSKPDGQGIRTGIDELKHRIAEVTLNIPEVGREVAGRWQRTRQRIAQADQSWMSWDDYVTFCTEGEDTVSMEQIETFTKLCHQLGDLIYYGHDDTLKDIVVLKPDWLATAISYVLDDAATRLNHGLVKFEHLRKLWTDAAREQQYPAVLHLPFVKLMERFDLCYEVAVSGRHADDAPTSLVSQLVDDNRPRSLTEWGDNTVRHERQLKQVCRIVDSNNDSANAEGLMFQLITRLHKFSLGRNDFRRSVHWRRGLLLDGDFNGRALLEHAGNDIIITVRAAYPERFLAILTNEVQTQIDTFWEGLNCEITVPCIAPCGLKAPGSALFPIRKLVDAQERGTDEYPCVRTECDEWPNISFLLSNAAIGDADPVPDERHDQLLEQIRLVREELSLKDRKDLHRWKALHQLQLESASRIDEQFAALINLYADEAKDGPRLFHIEPIDKEGIHRRLRSVGTERYRLVLWCEHARVPLTVLNEDKCVGVYQITLTNETMAMAAKFLGNLARVLRLIFPLATCALELGISDEQFDAVSGHLEFKKRLIDSLLNSTRAGMEQFGKKSTELQFSSLENIRLFHRLMNELDPQRIYGNLRRVVVRGEGLAKQRFKWVHPKFVSEY